MRARSRTHPKSMAGSEAALGARPAAADDELAAYCPDLDQWPTSWMYEERDLSPGRQIVKCFKPFLHHLLSRGLSRKSLRQHRDNLWLILSLPQRPQQLIGSRPVDMWTTLKKRCPHCPQPQQMQCQPGTHIDQGTAPGLTSYLRPHHPHPPSPATHRFFRGGLFWYVGFNGQPEAGGLCCLEAKTSWYA